MRFLPLLTLAALLLAPGLTRAETKTVRDFGAVGDGTTDDTAAVQRAIDSGVGEIVFPKGNYLLTKTVVVDLDRVGFTELQGGGVGRVTMAGSGPAFHFQGTHAASADPWNFKPNVWEHQRMPLIQGLEIVGAKDDADGLEITGVMQFTVAESLIRECRHAIHLTKLDRNIIIANCHLYHNRGCGVFYDHVNLHQSNIVGCHISYNAGGGVVTRGGQVRNVQIGTCDIESNMTPDAAPAANVLLDSTDGSTDEVAIVGCTLQHNSKSAGSANIWVIGAGITSEKDHTPTQEGHIAITGNVMSDVKVNIHLDHARGVNITGNSFWEGFEHDLLVENSQCVVVGPNDFDRNPRYVVNNHWGQDLNGLTFRNCEGCKLNGLIVKSVWKKEAAVSLEKCDRCTVTDCSILDCDGVGLLLKDCSRVRVSDCVIRDDRAEEEKKSTVSLEVSGGQDNWIHGNILANDAHVAPGSAILEGNRTR